MKKKIECIVTGRVQFVTFRYFTWRQAKRLGIFGMVQNLKDGSVRVVGEGEEEKLKELISCLEKGPMFAKVKNVETVWSPSTEALNDFHIIY